MGYKERFFRRVNKRGPMSSLGTRCWLWTGATNGNDYGVFQDPDGKRDYVHRIAWKRANGPIPKGLTVDHLCRRRLCVRPSHLDTCTLAENIRRAAQFRPDTKKSHCLNGHPMSGDNVRVNPRNGNRTCRTCARQWAERDRRTRGARKRGTFKPRNNVKLSEAQVAEIKKLYATKNYSQSELGIMFGISQTSVGRYVRGERYAEV